MAILQVPVLRLLPILRPWHCCPERRSGPLCSSSWSFCWDSTVRYICLQCITHTVTHLYSIQTLTRHLWIRYTDCWIVKKGD